MIELLIGFGVGLSLGAVLSWRDNNYRGIIGHLWLITFLTYFLLGILFFIKRFA